MTYSTTYGWIVLALDMTGRTSPASLDRIIGAADSLNKDIPSHSDLQAAIGWLLQEGLIYRQGRDYGFTQLGRDLMAEVKSQATNPFDGWDILKKQFANAGAPVELANISAVEWQQAYDTYYKRGMEMLR
jgi:hypothetical protein